MQIYVLISVAMVLLADERSDAVHGAPDVAVGTAFLAAWGPCLLGAVACWLASAIACLRLDRGSRARRGRHRRLRSAQRAERCVRLVPWLALAAFAWALFGAGWLGAVRAVIGDTILLDELVVLLPPMVVVIACWWFVHPLERRLRSLEAFGSVRTPSPEACALAADAAPPGPAAPSRAAHVLQQVRFNMLLLLVPMLAAIGLAEAVRTVVPRAWPSAPPWTIDVAAGAGVALLFVASPWLIRLVLDTRPLPDGELREALLDVCRRHRVRVSNLLVWRTRGTMLNGAVVGLVAPIRYVLLTDALLEALPRDQLVAVMAHEVGHVRRRHMLVAALGLVACAALGSMVVDGALVAASWRLAGDWRDWPGWGDGLELAAVAIAGIFTLVAFGAVSRRLERQADVFAVAHLSQLRACRPRPEAQAAPAVEGCAVEVMCDALAAVCVGSGGDPWRRSWRHGSIAARQAYLRTLTGAPIAALAIDRQVRWMAAACIAVVAAAAMVAMRG